MFTLPPNGLNKSAVKVLFIFYILPITSAVIIFSGCTTHSPTDYSLPPDTVTPRLPFPQNNTYDPSIVQPNHLSSKQQTDLIRHAYDNWKQSYLYAVSMKMPTPSLRVSAGRKKHALSFSEGIGYGMMLVVYMAGHDPSSQTIFNGLFRFAQQNPSRIIKQFMAFQVPVQASRRTSAFDGDADIAFALLLADKQWGSNGLINYRLEAHKRIDALLTSVIGRTSKLPLLGDWVDQAGQKYNQFTVRSSDFMISHFRVFSAATANKRWQEVIDASQQVISTLQKHHSAQTGLIPDFIVGSPADTPRFRPASPHFLESRYDGSYYYNATRLPYRLGIDAIIFKNRTSRTQLGKIANWLLNEEGIEPTQIAPGYHLDGRRIGPYRYPSKAFIGPFGIAAMMNKDGQHFVNRSFDLCISLSQDYYEDTLGLLNLLLMTGNHWQPH